jgi:hypothetical protein
VAVVETDWSALQAGMIAWVQGCTGRNAYWRDDRQFVGEPDPHFLLHLQNIEEQGTPGIVFDEGVDPTTSEPILVPRQQGMLVLTVEIACRSNDQAPGTLAQQEMQKLRSRYAIPGKSQPLDDAGVSFMTSRPVGSVDFEHLGRTLSQANAEFVFSMIYVYRDSEDRADWFESVNSDNSPDIGGVLPY